MRKPTEMEALYVPNIWRGKTEDTSSMRRLLLPWSDHSSRTHGIADEEERGESPFDGPAAEKSEAFQQTVDSKMDVESLRMELAKRAAAKNLGKRQRAVLVRQHELFVLFLRLLGEVDPDDSIFRILSEEMSVCERTIRRDLAEIRRFLMFRFQ